MSGTWGDSGTLIQGRWVHEDDGYYHDRDEFRESGPFKL